MEKAELRANMCQLRECLPGQDAAAASRAVCRLLAGWSVLRQARTVLAYLAFRNEIDLGELFHALPQIAWVLPRVEGQELVIHPYDPARLVRHRFGMLEPDPALPVVDARQVDLVLVPGVAFDRHGGRLGLGGGYYDRFLPTTDAIRVGVTHTACLVDAIPCLPHDQRMDWVVTPAEILRTGHSDGRRS